MASSTTLRVITNRLTTTPVNELPYVVSFLASSLSDCAEFNPQSRTGKINAADANEAVQINKLKARLTSLLQDRSVEGRWASVVLIKALLEAGGWDALRDCGPWVRGLLANLTVSSWFLCCLRQTPLTLLLETKPNFNQDSLDHHLVAHLPTHLSIPIVSARNNNSQSAWVYHSLSQPRKRSEGNQFWD